jgi:N-hydroxyarylamine O-acetyltransferase
MAATFDIDSYLRRVGHAGPRACTIETLRALCAAHLDRIPFENLDVRLGRPVSLDLAALVAKLVDRRRGGYCFEQNTLFAAALRALGFEVTTLEARVRPPGSTALLPRTHMVLRVDLDGRAWLVDVGFGGSGPLAPVPLDGEASRQADATYRIVREPDGVHVLERSDGHGSRGLYSFTLAPAFPVDYEVAHHFTSTFPRSPFVQTLTVQRSTPEARHILRGRTYRVEQQGDESVAELDDAAVCGLLRDVFALDVSDDEVQRALPAS